MKCERVENLIVDYLEKTLDEKTWLQVNEHIKKCESCQEELNKTKALFAEMEKLEDETPSDQLRADFYTMLAKEKANTSNKKIKQQKVIRFTAMKYAAIYLVLIGIGFLLGQFVVKSDVSNDKLIELQQQVNNLQNSITVTQLSKPSASERIQAVHVINKRQTPDTKMFNALIHTLNNDENINVRLAAANALTSYSQHDYVKDALINSLNKQEDPLMQITLINILVQMQDERAVQPLKQIIDNEKNPEIVINQAKEGLKVYL
jgi:HEAT repeat protein